MCTFLRMPCVYVNLSCVYYCTCIVSIVMMPPPWLLLFTPLGPSPFLSLFFGSNYSSVEHLFLLSPCVFVLCVCVCVYVCVCVCVCVCRSKMHSKAHHCGTLTLLSWRAFLTMSKPIPQANILIADWLISGLVGVLTS